MLARNLADRGGAARRIAGRPAGRGAIGGSADVIHDVRAGVLVAGHIGFHRVPAEQRERLVEVGGAGEVRDQQVFQAAVAQPDGDVREWNSRLIGLRDAILVVVDEGPGVEVGLPLGGRDVAHVDGLSAAQLPIPTGVERPSTSRSFHWSKTVTLQSPAGRPVSVKVPSPLHLVKAKSSPSGSPKLT